MPDEAWERLKEIFEAAKERPAAERPAFLDGACGGDEALRAEVEGLLEAHGDAGSFLGGTVGETRESPGNEKTGTMIDRYKLLQLIGEGGFGSVYMAEQEHPVRRKVALKIIKLGMDTRQVIARFEAERQALALMEHSNIARVLDAGSTEAGRPYFVMELVRGVPITEYCDVNSLSTRERLDLFQDVCSAVQHAHQKGVIHRDIKPSNVMVTLHDGKPVPKVIDFGIAKATNQRLTEKTLFTEYRQFIGTPQYMSPEQAEMSGLDVDTRADIYSLGVLLYELLTGTTPFDPERLRSAAFSEIHRIIREEDPHKPSTRISTLGEAATDTAKHRRTDLRTLRKALAGDLDWIVMKALEKDRTRRYDTANALLQDIRRHLRNEPVVAGPPGASYRIGKFLRRNRTAVSVAGVVTATLLLGLAAASYGFWEARRERVIATQAADSAEAVNAFFADMLASINPDQLHLHSAFNVANLPPDASAQFSHDVSVADMLRRAVDRVDEAFEDQPVLEASMRETIGTTLLGLDAFDDALEQFERAVVLRSEELGEDHPDVLRTRTLVAKTLLDARRNNAADEAAFAVLTDLERTLGPEDPLSLYAASLWASIRRYQGDWALVDSVFEVTLERQERVLGPDHRDTVLTEVEWAWSYWDRGICYNSYHMATDAYETALAVFGEDDAIVMDTEKIQSLTLSHNGAMVRAKGIMRSSIEKHRRVFGEEHGKTREASFALARALEQPREMDEKEALYAEVIRNEPTAYVAALDLGRLQVGRGKLDEGIATLRAQHEFWMDPDGAAVDYVRPERLSEIRRYVREGYRGVLSFAGLWDGVRVLANTELREARDAAEAPGAGIAEWNELAWLLLTSEPVDLRDPGEALVWTALALDSEATDVQIGDVSDTAAKAHALLGDYTRAAELQRRSVRALDRAGARITASEFFAPLVRYVIEADGPDAGRDAVRKRIEAIRETVDDSLIMARSYQHLGTELASLGLCDLADEPLRLAVEEFRGLETRRWSYLVPTLIDLAGSLARSGHEEEALAYLDEAQSALVTFLRNEDLNELWPVRGERWRARMAVILDDLGRREEAERIFRRIDYKDNHDWRSGAPRMLAASGDRAAALQHWRTLIADMRQPVLVADDREPGYEYGSSVWVRARAESDYASCLMELGRWEEAEPWMRDAHRTLREWCGPSSLDVRIAEDRLHRLDLRLASGATD